MRWGPERQGKRAAARPLTPDATLARRPEDNAEHHATAGGRWTGWGISSQSNSAKRSNAHSQSGTGVAARKSLVRRLPSRSTQAPAGAEKTPTPNQHDFKPAKPIGTLRRIARWAHCRNTARAVQDTSGGESHQARPVGPDLITPHKDRAESLRPRLRRADSRAASEGDSCVALCRISSCAPPLLKAKSSGVRSSRQYPLLFNKNE